VKPRNISAKLADHKLIITVIVMLLIVSIFVANFAIAFVIETVNFFVMMGLDYQRANFEMSWKEVFNFKKEYVIGYSMFYALVIYFIVKMVYKVKLNFDDLVEGQHGSRKFEEVSELKKQYKIIPSKDEEYEGSGGVIVGGLHEQMKPYRLMIDESPVHTMVIGITRSGKGETFVVPMIDVLSRAK